MELKVSRELEKDNGIIGKELLKQLSIKGQLLDLFTGSTFANLLNALTLNQSSVIGQFGPHSKSLITLDILRKRCLRQAKELEDNIMMICIYGRSKVGKSLLGNELIQQDVLPSKDNPSTSCACMIFSGPANTHAQVTMCADVDDEYINQVFQKFPNADNALETKLKNVRLNSRVNVEDIKTYVELPANVREYPLVEKVEMSMPLFGIEEEGIAIIDCPGTHENNVLSVKAITYTQRASIVIYVFETRTALSKHDSDVRHVLMQQSLGKDIIFVYNIRKDASEESIQEKRQAFRNVFGKDAYLHEIDLKKSDSPQFLNFRQELCTKLRERFTLAIGNFVGSFEKLLRAQHLFLCRLIALHVNQEGKIKGISEEFLISKYSNESYSLRQTVESLISGAERKLSEVKNTVRQWYLNQLVNLKGYIMNPDNHLTDLMAQFEPDNRSLLDRATKDRNPTAFEIEMSKMLQRAFTEYMGNKVSDFCGLKKLEFSRYVYELTNQIEKNASKLKSMVSQEIWGKDTIIFFDKVEKDIFDTYLSEIHQIALPSLVGVTGLAGAGVFGGIFFAGLVSSTIATGGGLLFGLVALGGGISSILKLQKVFQEVDEETAKISMVDSFISKLESSVSQPHFDQFIEEQLGNWLSGLKELRETLLLDINEVEALTELSNSSITINYESLLALIKMREDVTNVVLQLRDNMQQFGTFNFKNIKAIIKEKSEMNHTFDSCFVCLDKIVRCGHLCRKCDFILCDKCPYCSDPTWVKRQISGGEQDILRSIIETSLNGLEVERINPADYYHNIEMIEILIQKQLKAYVQPIENFTKHWAAKYEKIRAHSNPVSFQFFQKKSNVDSKYAIDVNLVAPLNFLVREIIQDYTPKDGILNYDIRRIVLRELCQLIYQPVWGSIEAEYRNMYYNLDNEHFALCSQCEIYFPADLNNEGHVEWDAAVEHLLTIQYCKSPFEKLSCISNMNKSICKAQYPVVVTADELQSALAYIVIRAAYKHLVSDINMIIDTLGVFLEGFDLGLVTLIKELCIQMKMIVELYAKAIPRQYDEEPGEDEEVYKLLTNKDNAKGYSEI